MDIAAGTMGTTSVVMLINRNDTLVKILLVLAQRADDFVNCFDLLPRLEDFVKIMSVVNAATDHDSQRCAIQAYKHTCDFIDSCSTHSPPPTRPIRRFTAYEFGISCSFPFLLGRVQSRTRSITSPAVRKYWPCPATSRKKPKATAPTMTTRMVNPTLRPIPMTKMCSRFHPNRTHNIISLTRPDLRFPSGIVRLGATDSFSGSGISPFCLPMVATLESFRNFSAPSSAAASPP